MSMHRIEKSQWGGFCRHLSVELPTKRATIEVASEDLGVQMEAHWVPVTGVIYDADDEALEFILDDLDHLVFHPVEVYAEYGIGGVESLAIIEHDAMQIVTLRVPMMLPSPYPLH